MENKDTSKKSIKIITLMIAATAVSKLLGMLRTSFTAYVYGATGEAAAFTIASQTPLEIFDIALGAAILGLFIPLYNSFEKDSREQNEYANIFLNFVLLAAGIIVLPGIIFSRQIAYIITPNHEQYLLELTSNLLRITFPTIIFAGSTYTFVGILQSKNRFLLPALVSAISNLSVIIYFIFLDKYFNIYGLCAACVVSWLVQLLTLLIPLIKDGYKYKLIIDFKNKAFLTTIKNTLPILAGSWFLPVTMLFFGPRFTSSLDSSGMLVADFNYSMKTYTLITGILTYGICNYVFPKLSRFSHDGDKSGFIRTVRQSISMSLFVIIPVSVLAFILKEPIISILYKRGEFTQTDVDITVNFFKMLIPSMLTFSLTELLNRIFYSEKKPFIPFISVICGIVVSLLFNLLFISVLNYSYEFISISYGLGQLTVTLILLIFLTGRYKGVFDKSFLINFSKIIISASVSFISAYFAAKTLNGVFYGDNMLILLIYCVIIFVIAAVSYALVNFILKTRITI